MSILVIGGTGFIGRFIVEQLIAEHIPVTVLTRNPQKMNLFTKQVKFIVGDLTHYDDLDVSSYQYFINCAGEIHKEELMQQLHVEATLGMLRKLTDINNAHWIQISSVGVYGKIRSGIVKEDSPFSPVGQYEITKADGELAIKEFCLKNNLNYTIIRPSNVFGPDMPNQSIAQLIVLIKRKLFFYIGTDCKGIMMNYIPVEDVAHCVVNCINNKEAINQDFIVSDELPIKEFVRIICGELNSESSFYHLPEPLIRYMAKLSKVIRNFPVTDSRVDALTTRVIYSTEKVKGILKYDAKVGLTSGLAHYVAYLSKS